MYNYDIRHVMIWLAVYNTGNPQSFKHTGRLQCKYMIGWQWYAFSDMLSEYYSIIHIIYILHYITVLYTVLQ